MINFVDLKPGDTVYLPLYPERKPLRGTVIYVHPEMRFFRVEFKTDCGDIVTESYGLNGPMLP